jgi:hypothetical protein
MHWYGGEIASHEISKQQEGELAGKVPKLK